MNEDKIRELEQMIAGYCIRSSCHHRKWIGGSFEYKVGQQHCHSKRVLRWLNEINKLKGGGSRD